MRLSPEPQPIADCNLHLHLTKNRKRVVDFPNAQAAGSVEDPKANLVHIIKER